MKLKWLLRTLFAMLFFASTFYIVLIETERYESNSIVLLKDLEKKQSMDLGSVLLGQSSNTMQDSKVLELYMRSHEMFNHIDDEYNLSQHYISDSLDFLQRLYPHGFNPFPKASQKNILKKYNEDLQVFYDDPSGTLGLTFIHTDATIGQNILISIIKHSEEIINKFSQENASIALSFINQQREDKRAFFTRDIKALIDYQNKHHTIDPSLDVERKVTILTELEMELIKNEVEYGTKIKTFNPNSRDIKMLKDNIRNISTSIKRVKQELSGSKKGKELNANVFAFELLKSDMEFSKEVYRQTLINLEGLKIDVAQQSKHLVVVAKPTLADDYTYPKKLWDIFTIFIILFFLYSILITIIGIIENHKD